MPIRWNAEVDQTLFFLILNQMPVTVDYAAISAAWPENKGEKPTPRAISERLHKIKKMAVQNGAGACPSKPGAGPKTPGKKTPQSATKKRKRALPRDEDSDDDDEDVAVKHEFPGFGGESSPSAGRSSGAGKSAVKGNVNGIGKQTPSTGKQTPGTGKAANGIGRGNANGNGNGIGAGGLLDGVGEPSRLSVEGTPASLRSERPSRAATAKPVVKKEQAASEEEDALAGLEEGGDLESDGKTVICAWKSL
ncbi:hypothetical protein K490DRAFT_56647 [Saccharata proteae CBS 121410]|uniref:Uncharacterized protein n=1 Tax=Saccharata proteae CBS 121410 TaxID=1314787 RepID=A0A9P4HVK5_9PEZI|nr:hypothetical protein K490DRAFT_56647 [Saccharata proteae CBS 121410]